MLIDPQDEAHREMERIMKETFETFAADLPAFGPTAVPTSNLTTTPALTFADLEAMHETLEKLRLRSKVLIYHGDWIHAEYREEDGMIHCSGAAIHWLAAAAAPPSNDTQLVYFSSFAVAFDPNLPRRFARFRTN